MTHKYALIDIARKSGKVAELFARMDRLFASRGGAYYGGVITDDEAATLLDGFRVS